MKQRILFITNIYPDPKLKLLNTTNVCHYFVREWVEMGYDVKVIYNYTIYHKFLHFIARFFEQFIANWALSIVNTDRQENESIFIIDSVRVLKLPIYKAIPRTKFSKKRIEQQVNKIIKYNKRNNFTPDIIIGHFHNPSLELVSLLKKEYPVKTCVILHGNTNNIKKIYKNNFPQLINSIDVWGYRSSVIGERFEKQYGKRSNSFICYSGIPEIFLTKRKNKFSSEEITKFIYVGALIKRKNPLALVYALDKTYQNKKFSLTFIGQGSQKKKIMTLVKKVNLVSNILFLDHISRKEVTKEIEGSEIFIMISENETFGLVYLEAMAKGCITIGSRDEGIDGVIIDGVNGFLCQAGNYIELENIIKKINLLSAEEKNKISSNAIQTASNLTDYKAAEKYIKTVISK